MKRILLLGNAGAGKSTLALKLSKRLGLPCIHLDKIFWKPGWVESEHKEFERKLIKILKTKLWVMDGHYGQSQELRQKYADTIIFLDINRWICLWRVLGRILKTHGRTRQDMAPGCYEQFHWGFLIWIWNFQNRGRLSSFKRLTGLKSNQKAFILRNAEEIQNFLNRLA